MEKYLRTYAKIDLNAVLHNINDNVKIEDEVTLVGKDGNNIISIEELADIAGSFNYEFACGIGNRVTRVYKDFK